MGQTKPGLANCVDCGKEIRYVCGVFSCRLCAYKAAKDHEKLHKNDVHIQGMPHDLPVCASNYNLTEAEIRSLDTIMDKILRPFREIRRRWRRRKMTRH